MTDALVFTCYNISGWKNIKLIAGQARSINLYKNTTSKLLKSLKFR